MPCSLEDSLGVLTKYQLDRIRIDSEIEGLSHLRKQELIDSLVSALPDRVSDHFMTFDSERYALARRIVDNNGYVTGVSLPLNKAEYLKHAGLFVFGKKDGKPALGMPGEFINAFLQCEQAGLGDQVKLNTELIQLTHGLLYYYGVLNLKQAHEFICSLTRANVDYSHYALLIKDISEYHEGISLRLDRIWDSRVFDVDKLQAAQDANTGIAYYSFTKAHLLKAGEKGYVDETSAVILFKNFLMENYKLDWPEAKDIVDTVLVSINNFESSLDILHNLKQVLEMPSEEVEVEIFELIFNLVDQTRRWGLKGHPPLEIRGGVVQGKGNIVEHLPKFRSVTC